MQDRKIFFNLHPQKKEKIRSSYVRPSGHCVLNGYPFQGKSKKLSQVVKRRKGVKGVTHLRSLSLTLCISLNLIKVRLNHEKEVLSERDDLKRRKPNGTGVLYRAAAFSITRHGSTRGKNTTPSETHRDFKKKK